MNVSFPSVHVGGRTFQIQEVRDGTMCDDLGEILFALGRINVAPNQAEDCLLDTILHELVHAIDFVYGSTGAYLTEEQVVRITGGLLTVFSDPRNVEFCRFLLEKAKSTPIKEIVESKKSKRTSLKRSGKKP